MLYNKLLKRTSLWKKEIKSKVKGNKISLEKYTKTKAQKDKQAYTRKRKLVKDKKKKSLKKIREQLTYTHKR